MVGMSFRTIELRHAIRNVRSECDSDAVRGLFPACSFSGYPRALVREHFGFFVKIAVAAGAAIRQEAGHDVAKS